MFKCDISIANVVTRTVSEQTLANSLPLDLPDNRTTILLETSTHGPGWSHYYAEAFARDLGNGVLVAEDVTDFAKTEFITGSVMPERVSGEDLILFADFSDSQWRSEIDAEIWIAALLARMPAAMIIELDTTSPSNGLLRQAVVRNASVTSGTVSTLDVTWWRAWSILGALAALQLGLVAAVLVYCGDVLVKDNSQLVVSLTLTSIMEEVKVKVSSIATEDEILNGFGVDKLTYGTIAVNGGRIVDLRRRMQVVKVFPKGKYD